MQMEAVNQLTKGNEKTTNQSTKGNGKIEEWNRFFYQHKIYKTSKNKKNPKLHFWNKIMGTDSAKMQASKLT